MVRSAVIAGVDLGPVTVAAADAFVDLLVEGARGAAVDATALIVDTHRIVTGSGPLHQVLTVTAGPAQDWQLWRLCGTAMRRHPALAVTVGRHSVGDGEALAAARAGIQERSMRIAGRCVYYPGVESLVGTMTAGQIVACSAIEVVAEVGGTPLPPDAEIVTGGHVRPRWEFGVLTLHVQHEGSGLHMPFEVAPSLPLV